MSKPATFTHAKVLAHEDWLAIAAWGYAMMMGDKYVDLRKELYEEIEKARCEYHGYKYEDETSIPNSNESIVNGQAG